MDGVDKLMRKARNSQPQLAHMISEIHKCKCAITGMDLLSGKQRM